MKQVFVVYETDAWHTIANRDCKGIYTSKRSAINAIVKNHEIDLEEIFEDDRLERASRRVLEAEAKRIIRKELGQNNGEIINTLINDLTENSKDKDYIGFSQEKFEIMGELKKFNYKYIYGHPSIKEGREKLQNALQELFDYYKALFEKYGWTLLNGIEHKQTAKMFTHYLQAMKDVYIKENASANQIVSDYIAGMTDNYALEAIKGALNYSVKL